MAAFDAAPDKDKAEALARLVVEPSAHSAVVMQQYGKVIGELNLGALTTALCEGMDAVWEGNLKQPEGMLFAQAQALQAIFTNLAKRAASQEYLSQLETFLRLALKAQNQCRMTLETLANVKNPPVVFARQANINNGGQQQVNNGNQTPGSGSPAPAPARESQPEPNKLLEASHVERLDFGAQTAAGGTHQDLVPVETVDRPPNRVRQSHRGAKRMEGRAPSPNAGAAPRARGPA